MHINDTFQTAVDKYWNLTENNVSVREFLNLRVLCSVYCSFEAADDDIAINCLDSDISGLNAEFDDSWFVSLWVALLFDRGDIS